jgi:iodotyrosine deiodinase
MWRWQVRLRKLTLNYGEAQATDEPCLNPVSPTWESAYLKSAHQQDLSSISSNTLRDIDDRLEFSMAEPPMIPLSYRRHTAQEMGAHADAFFHRMVSRRSVREFSPEPINLDAVRKAIHSAAQAPSGANKQPWKFILVTDPGVKEQIRIEAEKEEQSFYGGRAPETWLSDLAPLGTGPDKPFLEEAPALIVIMAESQGEDASKHYYVKESVGIACGFLLAALHHIGLATLTHTPSPMGFLRDILGRPAHEKPYLLIPIGYPVKGCRVPAIVRKPLADVLIEI